MITNEAQNDLAQFALGWRVLHSGCEDAKIRMDYKALEKYSMAEVEGAITEWQQNTVKGMFAPQPADLIGIIRMHRRQTEHEEDMQERKGRYLEDKRSCSTDEFRAKAMLEISKLLPGIKLGGNENVEA